MRKQSQFVTFKGLQPQMMYLPTGDHKYYARALVGPVMMAILGVLFGTLVIGYSPVDALYWSMCTMTTVGFGDLAPNNTWYQKVAAIFYLPLAVTALADSIAELSKLFANKRIREAKFEGFVDTLLLHEAAGDPNETLTEAEFLVSVLTAYKLIDEQTLLTVRQQFARLTRHGDFTEYEARVLTSEIVFYELVFQGRATGTFKDWFDTIWVPKVREFAEDYDWNMAELEQEDREGDGAGLLMSQPSTSEDLSA